MRSSRKLLIEQMDKKLAHFQEAANLHVPADGWIKNIRKTLNMTLEQLGTRLGKSKQNINKLEASEGAKSIRLSTLIEVGHAMDLDFVYGYFPKAGSLDKLIDDRARTIATQIVMRTNQSMLLENQEISQDKLAHAIDDLAMELKRELKRSLWD